MNIKEIKELLVLMKEHELTEIEIEKDGLKIKLRKNLGGRTYVEHSLESPTVILPAMKAAGGSAEAAEKAGAVPQESDDVALVRSPMVGTFYAAPAPDQPPYVNIGQAVKPGDVLCIVEAMKLMNEIKCEIAGTIMEVLVANGQPVEFDQPLFRIKKA
ncbi:MAG: acetyl-CoA carboxylase biotin carboxyl carrier protein [Candidatus Omnitrophica bacterium]|nr:acetyl-CoA carboxylase biotin carboxyl carrier protein [Candidatus Omnitrophota bacterium]MDD5671295.1 acetyl-CoA carboxylase biotin carboxyl carrier protein [Candidatus Omnitrophota bacterium]